MIRLHVEGQQPIALSVGGVDEIGLSIGGAVFGSSKYTGEYEVTPSDEVQVLETSGLMMTDNVTINPIPSNYGRIAWSGAGIIVY